MQNTLPLTVIRKATRILVLIFALFPLFSAAQSYQWLFQLPLNGMTTACSIDKLDVSADNEVYAVGEDQVTNWLVRLDSLGGLLHADSMAGLSPYDLQVMRVSPGSRVVMGGRQGTAGPDAVILVRDTLGAAVSQQVLAASVYGSLDFTVMESFADSGFVAAGKQVVNGLNKTFVLRLDTAGSLVWFRSYRTDTNAVTPSAICEDDLGGYFIAGRFSVNNNHFDPGHNLLHLSAAGDSLGLRALPGIFGVLRDMITTADGHLLLTGARDTVGLSQNCASGMVRESALLARVDTLGNLLGQYSVDHCNFGPFGVYGSPVGFYQVGTRFRRSAQGHILWAGTLNHFRLAVPVFPWLIQYIHHLQPFVALLDSNGNFQYLQQLGSGYLSLDHQSDFWIAPGGDLVQLWRLSGGPDGDNFLVRSSPFLAENQLVGSNLEVQVVYDTTGDCLPDSAAQMPEFHIALQPPAYSANLTQGQVGYFNLPADTYQVSLGGGNPYWRQTCPDNPPYHQVAVRDTLMRVNIGVEPVVSCPLMAVSLGSFTFRPCSPASYLVHCANWGTSTADSAWVSLEIDPLLTVTSAGIPWELPQSGNTYLFHLGAMAPGEEVTFAVSAIADCNLLPGQAICSSARMYPDSFCTPDTAWSGASLLADASCTFNGDTVSFTVRNVGSGNMLSGGNILVLEDNVLRMQFQVQLGSGQDTIFTTAANGSTWYIRADQPSGHPGSTFSADVLEACGTDSMGNFSTGFAAQLPLNDWDFYRDTECGIVGAPYDPNDKQGFPLGQGPLHLVDSTTLITYKVRFQNVGNDTAFNVIVRDTLPAEVDAGSFVPGSASHPYTVLFQAGRVLYFYFPSIMLPDSATDEPGSHGFIQFRARLSAGLSPGTVVRNNADIFFDFNAAVNTGEYFHTLDTSGIVTVYTVPAREEFALHTGPNPFRGKVRFRIDRVPEAPAGFALFDLSGRLLLTRRVNEEEWEVDGSHLAPGIYLYRYMEGDRLVATGKLIRLAP